MKERHHQKEELELERDPFGSFAKLDRVALSEIEDGFVSQFSTIESRPRYHSFDLSRTTLINPLPPPTVNNAVWHNKLDRTVNLIKQEKKFKEEIKLKEIEEDDQILKLLKPNWKSLLLKYEDQLQAQEMPYVIQNKFSSQFSHSIASTNLVFRQYKRYLKLCAIKKEDVRFICSKLIKWMWEYHTAQSLDYQFFSQHNFDGELDPDWFLFRASDLHFRQYQKTLEAYELIFKHPAPLSVWEKPEQKYNKKQQDLGKLYDVTGILNFNFKKNETRISSHKLRVQEKNRNEARQAIRGMCIPESKEEEEDYFQL